MGFSAQMKILAFNEWDPLSSETNGHEICVKLGLGKFANKG